MYFTQKFRMSGFNNEIRCCRREKCNRARSYGDYTLTNITTSPIARKIHDNIRIICKYIIRSERQL